MTAMPSPETWAAAFSTYRPTKSSSTDFSDPSQPGNESHSEEIAEHQNYSLANDALLDRSDPINRQPRPSRHGGIASAHRSRVHSLAFSLETLPATADFDWDERSQRPHSTHFVDGMAGLTERASLGYMRVASGAALLRLADNSGDLAAGFDNEKIDDSMPETPVLRPAIFTFSQLEPYIDAYVQTYHVSYPIVHEATFRAQSMEVIPRPKNKAWQVPLHIMAALGSFSASKIASETDVALFEGARARMSMDLLETGDLTLVQALTLMSNYVQKRNKPNPGYNSMGLVKRTTLGI